MFAQLAAVVLLAVGATSNTTAADTAADGAVTPPAAVATEAARDDLIEAGHDNGLLPAELLIELESSANCLLERSAAEHWLALEEQAAADGIELVARWCYRNLATQHATYDRNCPLVPAVPVDPEGAAGEDGEEAAPVPTVRKCRVATSKPGNSNHGWGRAIDVKAHGRLLTCESPEFVWLLENAQEYGWVHPGWAACGEPKEEPWHWEWAGAPVRDEPPPPATAVPSALTRDLAAWLAEIELPNRPEQPVDVGPNWVNAFLRGAEVS